MVLSSIRHAYPFAVYIGKPMRSTPGIVERLEVNGPESAILLLHRKNRTVEFRYLGLPVQMEKALESLDIEGTYRTDMPLTNRVLYLMKDDIKKALDSDLVLLRRTVPDSGVTFTPQLQKLFEHIRIGFRQE